MDSLLQEIETNRPASSAEIENFVAEAVRDGSPVELSSVDLDLSFTDLGLDSLGIVYVFTEAHVRYGIAQPEDQTQLDVITTPRGLVRYIQEKNGPKQ
jgi:acyl carrier protein